MCIPLLLVNLLYTYTMVGWLRGTSATNEWPFNSYEIRFLQLEGRFYLYKTESRSHPILHSSIPLTSTSISHKWSIQSKMIRSTPSMVESVRTFFLFIVQWLTNLYVNFLFLLKFEMSPNLLVFLNRIPSNVDGLSN